MTFGYFSLFEDSECEIDTEFHSTSEEAKTEAESRIRSWLNYGCHDEDDEPCASSGVLIRTSSFDTSPDSESPVPHDIDPLPQIREAFPAIARRLDALDELERRLSSKPLPIYRGEPYGVEADVLTFIREAKR